MDAPVVLLTGVLVADVVRVAELGPAGRRAVKVTEPRDLSSRQRTGHAAGERTAYRYDAAGNRTGNHTEGGTTTSFSASGLPPVTS